MDYKGGYVEFGLKRGNFRLGRRLTSTFEQLERECQVNSQAANSPESGFLPIKHDHALFLTDLGELKQAETILRELAFTAESYYYRNGETKSLYQYIARQNLCDVLVLEGKLREAEQLADGIIQAYESDLIISRGETQSEALLGRTMVGERYFCRGRLYSGSNPYARRALALSLQGKVHQALVDFKQAEAFSLRKTHPEQLKWYLQIAAEDRLERLGLLIPENMNEVEFPHRTLIGQAAIFYALLLTRLGKLDAALKVLDYSKRCAAHRTNNLPSMVVYAEVGLSDVYRLMGEYELALHNLQHPLEWAAQTGQKEIYCWAHLSLARLRHAQNQLAEAENALDEAYKAATAHGFKLYEIDCLVTAGWIALSRQDLVTAEQKVAAALELVSDPDMAYAWGQGNTLHLMGEILFQKNDLEKAQTFLTGAAKLRERIEDPRKRNTQQLLSQMSDTAQGT
ncbi:MAG: tetratricopeptide repeat protein [Coleofasciculus sp. S288]|nr:tetratricopeptide repeat protein [Coleofasciculus sp. S288]